jgi:hypothetical protein
VNPVDEADRWEQHVPVPAAEDDYPHDLLEARFVGDLSNACKCARNASAAGTGFPSSSSTVHDSAPSGINTRCTRIPTSTLG